MLAYGYCSVCDLIMLPDHLEEHRQDHHPELEVIFLRLTSARADATQARWRQVLDD